MFNATVLVNVTCMSPVQTNDAVLNMPENDNIIILYQVAFI